MSTAEGRRDHVDGLNDEEAMNARDNQVPVDLAIPLDDDDDDDRHELGPTEEPTSKSCPKHCGYYCSLVVCIAVALQLLLFGSYIVWVGSINGFEACEEPPCKGTINAGIAILVIAFALLVAVAVFASICYRRR